jgi:hypothetical protein
MVAEIRYAHVRRWRKALLDTGMSPVTAAKSYRLLKAIMNTAVEDGLIRRNPCRIKGAGQEKSAERPVLTIGQVFTLAETIAPPVPGADLAGRVRKPALGRACRAAPQGHRPGRLHRQNRTHPHRAIRRGYAFGPPKSDAGRRVVSFPNLIAPDLTWHLARFTGTSDDALIFTSPTGAPLRHGNFRRLVWLPALTAASLPAIRFHDGRRSAKPGKAPITADLAWIWHDPGKRVR